MFEALLGHILSSAKFNRLMFVLAIEGGSYLFTKDWDGWTVLNAAIYGIIGYVIITLCCYLESKFSKWKKNRNKSKQDANLWEKSIKNYWDGLSIENQSQLINIYERMNKSAGKNNIGYFTQSTRDINEIINFLNYLDCSLMRCIGGFCHEEHCIKVSSEKGSIKVEFDPYLCKIIEQRNNNSK